jgi:hypothetical protein
MSDLEPNSVFSRSKFACRMRHCRQRKRFRHGRPRMVSVRMLPRKSYRLRLYEYRILYKP